MDAILLPPRVPRGQSGQYLLHNGKPLWYVCDGDDVNAVVKICSGREWWGWASRVACLHTHAHTHTHTQVPMFHLFGTSEHAMVPLEEAIMNEWMNTWTETNPLGVICRFTVTHPLGAWSMKHNQVMIGRLRECGVDEDWLSQELETLVAKDEPLVKWVSVDVDVFNRLRSWGRDT